MFLNIGIQVGIWFALKVGVRLGVFIALILQTGGVLFAAFSHSTGLSVFLLGIINGFGTGMNYLVPISLRGWKFFPNSKGKCIFSPKKE